MIEENVRRRGLQLSPTRAHKGLSEACGFHPPREGLMRACLAYLLELAEVGWFPQAQLTRLQDPRSNAQSSCYSRKQWHKYLYLNVKALLSRRFAFWGVVYRGTGSGSDEKVLVIRFEHAWRP